MKISLTFYIAAKNPNPIFRALHLTTEPHNTGESKESGTSSMFLAGYEARSAVTKS